MSELGRMMAQGAAQTVPQDMAAAGPAGESTAGTITELKASAHLMTLDQGLFCVFQTPGHRASGDVNGLPGVRITLPPDAARHAGAVTISSFRDDGWLSLRDDAALVRVNRGPAQVLVTIYQMPGADDAPKLQVMRLSDAAAPARATPPAPAAVRAVPPSAQRPSGAGQVPEVGAHIQMRGDVGVRLGEWLGDRGSRRWIEGFAIAPRGLIALEDIEYQALLGRGWLSPWAEGGRFCGSRGMSLPILGLRVRLRGAAAEAYDCVYSASFVDGASAGPAVNGQPCEADTLAPLEAFQVELRPRASAPSRAVPPRRVAAPARAPAPKAAASRAPGRKKPAPVPRKP